MSKQLTYKKNLVNPQKWIGKYVRHLANWRDFQWLQTTNDNATDDYFVDEWTGKLYRACDQGYWGDVFETKEEAEAAGFDEFYYYNEASLLDMYCKSQQK